MSGRRSVIGISVLCALVFSAFAVTSVFAAQRAVRCAPGGTQFSDAHCKTAGTGFGHVDDLANGVATGITGTNEKTASNTMAAEKWKLKTTLSGITLEIQCTGLSGIGELTNAASSVSGKGEATFTGCTVTVPAGHFCVVTGGAITTEELVGTTVGQAANRVKISPAIPPSLASITISGCDIPALNNTYSLTGSIIVTTSGATMTVGHTDTTGQGTLKFAGNNKAGIEGAATLKTSGGSPLALT